MEKYKTAALLTEQLAGESGAIQNYELVLASGELTPEDADVIKEIIADEKNHSLKLQAMIKNYDGGIAASADGAKDALDKIADGTDKTE